MADTFTPEQVSQIVREFLQTVGTRQYIGARYVPIFGRRGEESIEWDDSAPYEPLTIVLYQGNSYTSRQYVPAGIPITNTEFWASTGIYNAQIEQYRAEVQQAFELAEAASETAGNVADVLPASAFTAESTVLDMIERNAALNPEIYVSYSSSAVLLYCEGDTRIAFDCGGEDDETYIRQFFAAHGVTQDKPLDALVVSHYHADHYGGYSFTLDYCGADTDIFVQMDVPTTNAEYSWFYGAKTAFLQAIQEKGLPTPVVPAEGRTYTYGNTKLTNYNTTTANLAALEGAWATSAGDTRASGLNLYSIISVVECNGFTFVNTSDIEGVNQEMYAQTMPKASVATVPHHLANPMGVKDFFDSLDADVWLVTNNFQSMPNGSAPYRMAYGASYWYRYQLYNDLTTPCLINCMGEVSVTTHDGKITAFDGYNLQPNLYVTTKVPASALLPPNLYDENPYYIRTIGLGDLWAIKNRAIKYPAFELTFEEVVDKRNYVYKRTADDTPSLLWQQAAALVDPYNLNNAALMVNAVNPTIETHSPSAPYTVFELAANYAFDAAEPLKNCRCYSKGVSPQIFDYSASPIANGGSAPSADRTLLNRANMLSVTLDNGAIIGVYKTTVTHTGNAVSQGVGFSGNGNTMYRIVMSANAFTVQQITISTGAVETSRTITRIGVIC